MAKKSAKRFIIQLKAGVLVRHRGRVLLIRERHGRTHRYAWNIIKGTFEPNKDKSIMETATREALEEAGAKVRLRYLLSTSYLLDENNALMMFTFVADLVSLRKSISQKLRSNYSQGEDIIEVKFFTRRELSKLKPIDFIGIRGYLAVRDYLTRKRFSLDILQTLSSK